MPKRQIKKSEQRPAKRRTNRQPVQTTPTNILSCPTEVQERIFSFTRLPTFLHGRSLAHALRLTELPSQIPGSTEMFSEVQTISLSTEDHIDDMFSLYAHTVPSISITNLLKLIQDAGCLQKVMLPNVPAEKYFGVLDRSRQMRWSFLRFEARALRAFFASLGARMPPSPISPVCQTPSYHNNFDKLHEIAFTDAPGIDVAPFVLSLKKVHVSNPRQETIETLTHKGIRIREIYLEDLDPELAEAVKKLLEARALLIRTISIKLQLRPGQDLVPITTEQVLQGIFTSITRLHGRMLWINTIILGPMTNVGCALFHRLILEMSPYHQQVVSFYFDTIDPLGTCYPIPTTLEENPEPRILSFRHKFLLLEPETGKFPASVKEVVMENHQMIEDCISREVCCSSVVTRTTDIIFASMSSRCPPLILQKQSVMERFRKFKNLKLLSVRLWVRDCPLSAYTILLGLLWFLTHLSKGIRLEVPKEFISLPQIVDERNKAYLWWEPFRQVKVLLIRNKVRPMTFEGAFEEQILACDYQFVKDLPEFIVLLQRAFPELREVVLESSENGSMNCANSISNEDVDFALVSAIKSVELYEKLNEQVDISSIKAQLQLWEDKLLRSWVRENLIRYNYDQLQE